jgi:spore maturation protein CgeB
VSLRLLVVSQHWPGSLGDTWARHFAALGYVVTCFDEFGSFHGPRGPVASKLARRLATPIGLARAAAGFDRAVERARPDAILLSSGRYLFPRVLRAVQRRTGARLLSWNPDNPFNPINSSWLLCRAIPLYDVHFTWSERLLAPLREAGARRVVHLPFGYDPELHPLVEPSADDRAAYGADVVFVGTWEPERERLLSQLTEFDLAIWGNMWDRLSPASPLRSRVRGTARYGAELCRLYRSAKIVLNILRSQNAESHNMRTFEVPGCGAFQLAPYTPEQACFFVEGEAIAFYRDVEDLRRQIRHYLAGDEERERIARAGRAVVLAGHTYGHRIRVLDGVLRELVADG